jgi:hypothetical protein
MAGAAVGTSTAQAEGKDISWHTQPVADDTWTAQAVAEDTWTVQPVLSSTWNLAA